MIEIFVRHIRFFTLVLQMKRFQTDDLTAYSSALYSRTFVLLGLDLSWKPLLEVGFFSNGQIIRLLYWCFRHYSGCIRYSYRSVAFLTLGRPCWAKSTGPNETLELPSSVSLSRQRVPPLICISPVVSLFKERAWCFLLSVSFLFIFFEWTWSRSNGRRD